MNYRTLPYRLALPALVALVVVGCTKEDPIKTYTTPKETAAELVSWSVPTGWKKAEHNPTMQYAAFTAGEGNDQAKISVSFLSTEGPGARDLLQNVNRWRGQLQMPPISANEAEAQVVKTTEGGMTTQTVDLSSLSGQRIRAIIVPREDRIWFFKMTGSIEGVQAQKDAFDGFVKSSKFTAPPGPALVAMAQPVENGAQNGGTTPQTNGSLPPGHPPVTDNKPTTPTPFVNPPPQAGDGELKYTLPAGWAVDPNPRPMRVLTATTGGDKPAALIVTRLSANFGGMLMNINRWRGEVGLQPVSAESEAKETPVKIGSVDGQLFDFSGPGRDGNTPTRSMIARCTVGDSVWFFKILGPADSVGQQQEAYKTFLSSVKF